jgi:hypothetical protein
MEERKGLADVQGMEVINGTGLLLKEEKRRGGVYTPIAFGDLFHCSIRLYTSALYLILMTFTPSYRCSINGNTHCYRR